MINITQIQKYYVSVKRRWSWVFWEVPVCLPPRGACEDLIWKRILCLTWFSGHFFPTVAVDRIKPRLWKRWWLCYSWQLPWLQVDRTNQQSSRPMQSSNVLQYVRMVQGAHAWPLIQVNCVRNTNTWNHRSQRWCSPVLREANINWMLKARRFTWRGNSAKEMIWSDPDHFFSASNVADIKPRR